MQILETDPGTRRQSPQDLSLRCQIDVRLDRRPWADALWGRPAALVRLLASLRRFHIRRPALGGVCDGAGRGPRSFPVVVVR